MSDNVGPDMYADDVPLLQEDEDHDSDYEDVDDDDDDGDAAAAAAAATAATAAAAAAANTEGGRNAKRGRKAKGGRSLLRKIFNPRPPFGLRPGVKPEPLVTRSHLMFGLLKSGPMSITIVPSEKHKMCFHSLRHIQVSSLSCIMRATTVKNNWEISSCEYTRYFDDMDRGILPNGERMKTFHTWKLTFTSINQMESAGFYSFDQQDLVECFYCDEDSESLIIGPIPPGETPQRHLFKDILADPSGSYDSTPYSTLNDCDFDQDLNRFESFLYRVGFEHKKKVHLHNKGFTTFDSRLKSFDRCEKVLSQSVRTLSEAGFYYIGNGENDMMLCFCCNQGLMDWEFDDNPWVEHARWAPECNFVLLKRGKHFVNEVARNANANKKDLNKLIPSPEMIIEQNMPDLKRVLDNAAEAIENKELMSEVKQRVLQTTPSMPDSKLCKICFKEKLEVVFISCAHVIACIECAVTLDECALCREPLTMLLRVYLGNETEQLRELRHPYPYFEREVVEVNPESTTLCKICSTEEMSALFFPCRHINTCEGCISKVDKCPVCSEPFMAFLPVFL